MLRFVTKKYISMFDIDGIERWHPVNEISINGYSRAELTKLVQKSLISKSPDLAEEYTNIINSTYTDNGYVGSVELIKIDLGSFGIKDRRVSYKKLIKDPARFGFELCPIETMIYLKLWQVENHFEEIFSIRHDATVLTKPIVHNKTGKPILFGLEDRLSDIGKPVCHDYIQSKMVPRHESLIVRIK